MTDDDLEDLMDEYDAESEDDLEDALEEEAEREAQEAEYEHSSRRGRRGGLKSHWRDLSGASVFPRGADFGGADGFGEVANPDA